MFIKIQAQACRSFFLITKRIALMVGETDPTLDVDGWDATLKVCAISKVVMGVPIKPADVQRQGIRDLQPEMLRAAHDAGQPFKLVASVERTTDGVLARVQPEQIAPVLSLA